MRGSRTLLLGSAAALFLAADIGPALAQIDEIIVTARKREESLQDVPVSIQAIGTAQIDKYQIDSVREIENLVPNLRIQQGGSGGGGTIRLRGIGSSAITAAFDTAVAFNIDGISANSPKFLQNNTLDLEQIEVLKGPQSLYFGKSASAGVISLQSANPTDELSASISGSYEFEEKGMAFRAFGIKEVMKNTAGPSNYGQPSTGQPFGAPGSYFAPSLSGPEERQRDESSIDWRLTLDWEATDKLRTNFKFFRSDWEHDGQLYSTDILCRVPGSPQMTAYPFGAPVPSGYDCTPFDREIQLGDQNDIEGSNVPGNNGGVPFYEQTIMTATLRTDYDITDSLTLTNVSGWFNLKDDSNDCYGYDANGIGCNIARNARDNISSELRLASDFGGMFDFLVGGYYQHRRIIFNSYQYAVGITTLVGPDPTTGITSDWLKQHTTDTDAFAFFGNIQFRPIEPLEIVAGVRWSRERHKNSINFPFVHDALAATNPGVVIPLSAFDDGDFACCIEFADENISPEVTGTYDLTDEVTLYAAYKTGFKSGGIDNSALPSSSLSIAAATNDFSDIVFNSESAQGYEGGIRSEFQVGNNAFRMNITGFRYVFEDLQVQLFDAPRLAFITTNAEEVTQIGSEFEGIWQTPIEGLTFNTTWAYTSAKYTEDFFVDAEGILGATLPNVAGNPLTGDENLKGRQIIGNAKWSGNVGFDYSAPLASLPVSFNLGGLGNYTSDFNTEDASTGLVQESVWKFDAYAGIEDVDGLWGVRLIGQNLSDEVTIVTSGGRPFTVPTNNPELLEDQVVNITRGRQVTLEATLKF